MICSKPLYRRPFELAKVRHVACMEHRAEAQRREGQTDSQKAALVLGRPKGTNHLEGIPKSEASKQKRSTAIKRWCDENPADVVERSKKTRGSNHYNWKGGSSRLNTSIRQMNENRKWMDAVKERDRCCLGCGEVENLESHHIIELAVLLVNLNVASRREARECLELWDLANGETLCRRCHYKRHRRTYAD